VKRDEVVFRGTKNGLLIQLSDQVEFPALLQRLREKLEAAGRFFEGAEVTVNVGTRDLDAADQALLEGLLGSTFGLRLLRVTGQAEETGRPGADEEPLAIVERTIRSGQTVRHSGTLVILGDVNPGAEVIAGGNIVIMGALRGVAHAGAGGNSEALVAASRLQPTQLRIGGVISRPPDNDQESARSPEVARVRDGKIVIDSFGT
jgi:septum site-determining protein MinC